MKIYYDVQLVNDKGGSVSYWADSFSVDEYRILRVKSCECGDITVQINPNEKLIVSEVHVNECEICGDYDSCERMDLVGEPVLCDNCYALELYDKNNFGNAVFNDWTIEDSKCPDFGVND